MKIFQILLEAQAMAGTNCTNCKHTKGSPTEDVKASDLNEQGGTIPENAEQLKLAEKSDLITMPGKDFPKVKAMCTHPKVKQWVNSRMCCAFWDAPGTLRAYGKQSIG